MKYRDLVHEIALDNHGYVTTRAAVEAGVPAVELPKLAARGGMENVAYGLYRVSTVPRSEIDQFAEALLRAGEGAYLYGESVLALLGLADVTPAGSRWRSADVPAPGCLPSWSWSWSGATPTRPVIKAWNHNRWQTRSSPAVDPSKHPAC